MEREEIQLQASKRRDEKRDGKKYGRDSGKTRKGDVRCGGCKNTKARGRDTNLNTCLVVLEKKLITFLSLRLGVFMKVHKSTIPFLGKAMGRMKTEKSIPHFKFLAFICARESEETHVKIVRSGCG